MIFPSFHLCNLATQFVNTVSLSRNFYLNFFRVVVSITRIAINTKRIISMDMRKYAWIDM